MSKVTQLLAMGLSSIVSSASFIAANEQPNILIVFVDGSRAGDVSCYSCKKIQTPAIDRLASEGLRFNQFYVASAICSPSQCGFMTGHFPAGWEITSDLQSTAENRE